MFDVNEKIENQDTIKKISQRGAYLLQTDEDKEYWIAPKMLRKDGTLTPAGEKARAEAKAPKAFTSGKPHYKIHCTKIQSISEKAIRIVTHGHAVILPKSQVKGADKNFVADIKERSDFIYVPVWLAKEKMIDDDENVYFM